METSAARRLLGLPAHHDKADVRSAWRRAARRAHPDVLGGDAARFRELRAAAELLVLEAEARGGGGGGGGGATALTRARRRHDPFTPPVDVATFLDADHVDAGVATAPTPEALRQAEAAARAHADRAAHAERLEAHRAAATSSRANVLRATALAALAAAGGVAVAAGGGGEFRVEGNLGAPIGAPAAGDCQRNGGGWCRFL